MSTQLATHFKLSSSLLPRTKEEMEYMSHVPYASAIDSIMYVMVCTRPNISHVVSVVSRYMDCLRKIHWEAMNGYLGTWEEHHILT